MVESDTPRKEASSAALQEAEIQELIERRGIQPIDFALIEALARLPKQLILEHHNFFQASRERSREELQLWAEHSQGELKIYYETMLAIVNKYDWTVAWNLQVVLERRKHAGHI